MEIIKGYIDTHVLPINHFLLYHRLSVFFGHWNHISIGSGIFQSGTLIFKAEHVVNEKRFLLPDRKVIYTIEFIRKYHNNFLQISYYEKIKKSNKRTEMRLNWRCEKMIDICNDVPLEFRTFSIDYLFSNRGNEILTKLSKIID